MRHKEQNSSYDGEDIRKVFVPFSTILRDMPEQAALAARTRWTACS